MVLKVGPGGDGRRGWRQVQQGTSSPYKAAPPGPHGAVKAFFFFSSGRVRSFIKGGGGV